ncbi:MAG: capsule biosynthesis protein CapA [Paracoccaceae bacterium]
MTSKTRSSDGMRRFLMLQGPHGPFFRKLSQLLTDAGAEVCRVGFNRGDQFFWRLPNYIAFTDAPGEWPATCRALMRDRAITDLIVYGEGRPIHAEAIAIAKERGITVHIFEEGYLRPYWATYERGGSNGNSRLTRIGVEEMRAALARSAMEQPEAPATWGDMREHIFYGALYHFMVMAMNRRYRNFRSHRGVTVAQEFRLYLRRLLLMPAHRIGRGIATARIRLGGYPYHLILMQLEHDASFRVHSDFASMTDVIALCLAGFAEGAPPHHHVVFKAHPLEDERSAVTTTIRETAARLGITHRVHFVRGGKLARLLNGARSAVTVNSTAGQQVLWRGLPLKTLGRSVYNKPEFISDQPLAEFFAAPDRPDARAYRDYRHYLLETSQVPGGFYSARGRRFLLRQVVDMILAREDPYDALTTRKATPRQQLRGDATGD